MARPSTGPATGFVPFTGYDPADGDDPRVTPHNPLHPCQLATFEAALEDPASPMWAAPEDAAVEFDPEDCPDG